MPVIQTISFRRRDGLLKGAAWLVTDTEALARGIAQIAMGQWEHVEALLLSGDQPAPSVGYSLEGAIGTLSAPSGSPDWLIWHRDGWVFQAISWIAAVEGGRGPARPPHIGHAEKGFDGVQLLLSRDGGHAKRLIIFEDKATENPRDTVRSDVWPAFRDLESGKRDQALRSELSSLLYRTPQVDKVEAADRVMNRAKNRSYRVAVTIGATHDSIDGIRRLFKGYSGVVQGRRLRRRAHVLRQDDIRAWLAEISDLAIAHLEALSTDV